MLSKPELFARLAEGHAAGITVVTPNARLAQELTRRVRRLPDGRRACRCGKRPTSCSSTLSSQRLWEEALVSERGAKLPLLLSAAQEQHLWEQILEKSGLLAVPQAAAQCRDAWRQRHAWRIRGGPASEETAEDAAAFAAWVAGIRAPHARRGRRRAPARRGARFRAAGSPKLLVAYAFDIVPPQTKEFLARFELAAVPARGARREARCAARSPRRRRRSKPPRSGRARASRRACGASASWSPTSRQRRREVARIFSRVMRPGYNLPGVDKAPLPFNLSLGLPLDSYPLVGAALDLLELAFGAIAFERASRLVRSPFLGGAEGERARRAALDVWLRKNLDATVSLPKLIGAAERCPHLRACLEQAFQAAQNAAAQTPSEWARQFSARARRGRLSRRARARLGGIPDAAPSGTRRCRSWRSSSGCRSGMSARECLAVLRRICARHAVPARVARRPGAGARRARVGGAALRLPVGQRPHRRGLAAAGAPQPVHPARAAEEGRHSRGERRRLARARPPRSPRSGRAPRTRWCSRSPPRTRTATSRRAR